MKYDPIMCMMVDDSVKTKDEAFIIEAKKEGRPYKAIVNGEEKEIEKYYTHKGFTDIKLTKTKGKYSNTLDKAIKSCDEEYKMKVTSYVINKGQSGEYYGLKNKETNQVLYSAPNNWKSREGAKRWAEKKGMIYED